MIIKEKLYIERDINYKIAGDFWINDVTGTKGRVRATDPGFVFNATIYDDVTKIEYEYKIPVRYPKKLVGEFVVITDKEDIKIPYEFILFDNRFHLPKEMKPEDVTPEMFLCDDFGKQFQDNSKEYILWEAYKSFEVSKENILEFYVAIGKLDREEEKSKDRRTHKIVHDSKKLIYTDIQRTLIRYFTGLDSEVVTLNEIKKNINILKNIDELEYRIKIVEYFWAKISKDTLRSEYIFESLRDKVPQEDKIFHSIFLYITAIQNNIEDEMIDIANKLEIRAYELNIGIIYWLSYKLKSMQDKTANELYIWLKKIVSLGNNSPFIFMEINKIIEKYDTAVLKVDYIEIKVLYWAYCKGILSQRLIEYLISKSKYISGYHTQLFNILKNEYVNKDDKNILELICSLLIHGNKMDRVAFDWYKLGIEKKVRLTSIFEYFLYSIPTCYSENLPIEVYMYFKDNKMLTDKNKQSLYYNIIKNRDNIITIYDYYRSDMNEYALKALKERRISDELVEIYNEFPPGIIMDKTLSHCMLNIYCTFRFKCFDPNIRKLIVVQARLSNLIEVWPINGIADARIPDSNFLVLAEMNDDTTVLCNKDMISYKRIMKYNNEIENAFKIGKNHIVALMENKNPTIETLQEINKKKWLRNYYKRDIQGQLLKYYALNKELDNHILEFDIDLVDNKKELINEYINIGEYKLALKSLINLGFETVNSENKLKLFNGILSSEYQITDVMRDLALNLYFEGVRDIDVVMFLYEQHELTLEDEIENYDSLRIYLSGDGEFYDKIDSYCVQLIEKNSDFAPSKLYIHLWDKRDELTTIKILELLRRFSMEDDYNDEIRDFILKKLDELVSVGVYLEWMQRFKAKGLLPGELSDKVILTFPFSGYIQYKYSNSKKSVLNEKKLNKITNNTYVVAIPMFYGDQIEYKIVDEDREDITNFHIYENDNIYKSYKYRDGFDRVNEIIYAKKNNDPKLNKLIGEYKGLKDLALNLFKPRV